MPEPTASKSSSANRSLYVALVTVVLVGAIALYVGKLLFSTEDFAASATDRGRASLTIATTPAVGRLGGNPTWVSFLARDGGTWKHTTDYEIPANSEVTITILNFDGASGLRNPYYAYTRGTVGGTMRVDDKLTADLAPSEVSHTFSVPELNLHIPIPGVPDSAKNPCAQMPCSLRQAHRTVTFTMRTGKPGRYHFQCFVPCAAGFMLGLGGPMQTTGYMDGFLSVV